MSETIAAHPPLFTRASLLRLAAVVALALVLRLAGLHYSLWNDEVASIKFAAAPVHLLWSDWMVRETNPPLYYTLLHGWIALFGGTDATLRIMSVLFGCVGVALVYLLGRRAGGERAGLLAAALVALSAQNVLYSQQVRGYILGYAAAVAAVLATVQLLETRDDPRRRRMALLLYAPACAVALYAHTTFFVLPALLNLYVLALLGLRRQWLPALEWVAANAVVLLLWAWWAYITVLQARTRATIGWIEPPSFPYAVRMTLESYLPWQLGPVQFGVALVMVAAAGWAAWRWRRRPALLLLPFLAVATPAVLFVLSQRVPMFLNRTVYWSSAPFLVTVAAGLVSLRPRWLAGGAGVALAATVAGWLVWYPTREIEPWQAIVASLERQQPGATVLVSGRGVMLDLQRYCPPRRCSLHIVGVTSPATDAWASGFAVPGILTPSAVPALLASRHRLIAVRWTGEDPRRFASPDLRAVPVRIPVGDRDNIAASLWQTP